MVNGLESKSKSYGFELEKLVDFELIERFNSTFVKQAGYENKENYKFS